MRSRALWVLLSLAWLGCRADPANLPDAGVSDAGPPDAGPADAGAPDAGPPTALPFPAEQVLAITSGPELDYESTVFERASDSAWVAVFERLETTQFAGALWQAVSVDHQSFGPPSPLTLITPAMPLVAGPSALEHALYLTAGDPAASRTRLFRSAFLDGGFSTAGELELADPFTGMYAWPNAAAMPDGGVALAYDHYQTGVYVAHGDGTRFAAPTLLGMGVLGRVVVAPDGEHVATFQRGFGGTMTAFYRRSAEGQSWSSEAAVTTSSTNVHDARPFLRADGRIDLYYLFPGPNGFAIHRRRVGAAGLGVEQRVSPDAISPVTEPHPHRLADGRILLTFTRERVNQLDYDAACTVISGDAP
jgi:hypothetical protein